MTKLSAVLLALLIRIRKHFLDSTFNKSLRDNTVGVVIAAHNAGVGRRPSVQSAAPLAAMPSYNTEHC